MSLHVEFPKTDLIGCRFPEETGRNGEIKVCPTSKEYTYRLLSDQPTPKIGDLVVTSCVNGFQVCVVTTLNVTTAKYKDVAYVVGVVDAEAYTTQLRKAELKVQLHQQLMEKKKELDEQVLFDLLAEKSPEFAALLKAYRSL